MNSNHSVVVSSDPIDTQQVVEHVRSTQSGALVVFLGIAREFTAGRKTTRLAYEAYQAMAEQELSQLIQLAAARWPVDRCRIEHRLGVVDLGETCVAVAVSTPHRREAFEAAQWIMDELKKTVPIWKQEKWSDGATEWVHPEAEVPDETNKP